MSDPFLGEIKMLAFDWAPKGWAMCDGTVLQINQNAALAALLGTAFGGNGSTTFGLPDLRGRTPLCTGALAPNTYARGNAGGVESVALTATQVPGHQHFVSAYPADGTVMPPTGALPANAVTTSGSTTDFSCYLPNGTWTPAVAMNANSVSPYGGGQPHNNMQPYTVVNFCISTVGIFPPRN